MWLFIYCVYAQGNSMLKQTASTLVETLVSVYCRAKQLYKILKRISNAYE